MIWAYVKKILKQYAQKLSVTETKTFFASVSIDIQTLIKKNLYIFLILFCKK